MSGCFLTTPLFWRRLSGTFQGSQVCSRRVWSLLHCYGGAHGWISEHTQTGALGSGIPLKFQCFGYTHMQYSKPTSLQMWTHFCSWWCSSVCWKRLTLVETQLTFLVFFFSCKPHIFLPTPAKHHAYKCRISPTALLCS